ncbi:MAG: KpsF/GutQ family sugar-phosphate isomerase [Beijerinckiaceae bacterium]|nr:KpsF/GutQ family sugar-phosphate isomerase [Beijerinckiaceae bacterium]
MAHQSAIQSAQRTLLTEGTGLKLLHDAMGEELGQAFAQAVETILAAPGRVIISGMGKSGHVGRKIAATMASTGTPAHFVHPGEASHGDLGMIQPDDVILAMSWSGESSELADIIAYARHNDVKLIGITSRADSSLGVGAHICLCLPKAKEACPNGLAPTTSTTMQLALGDALAVALLESRGFTSQDFRRYHPGGKLGAQLRQVSAVMHTGDRLPLIQLGKMMSEAIVTISSKGLGCVIVVNSDSKLGGLVTDGDLRRHMAPDLLGRSVDEIMTKSPKTVTPDTLIAEALEIMESRKISSLVVVEDERPVGLIHILDLLRIGAA